jgi:hypothetical protein
MAVPQGVCVPFPGRGFNASMLGLQQVQHLMVVAAAAAQAGVSVMFPAQEQALLVNGSYPMPHIVPSVFLSRMQAYYQQMGRASALGDQATLAMLYAQQDATRRATPEGQSADGTPVLSAGLPSATSHPSDQGPRISVSSGPNPVGISLPDIPPQPEVQSVPAAGGVEAAPSLAKAGPQQLRQQSESADNGSGQEACDAAPSKEKLSADLGGAQTTQEPLPVAGSDTPSRQSSPEAKPPGEADGLLEAPGTPELKTSPMYGSPTARFLRVDSAANHVDGLPDHCAASVLLPNATAEANSSNSDEASPPPQTNPTWPAATPQSSKQGAGRKAGRGRGRGRGRGNWRAIGARGAALNRRSPQAQEPQTNPATSKGQAPTRRGSRGRTSRGGQVCARTDAKVLTGASQPDVSLVDGKGAAQASETPIAKGQSASRKRNRAIR